MKLLEGEYMVGAYIKEQKPTIIAPQVIEDEPEETSPVAPFDVSVLEHEMSDEEKKVFQELEKHVGALGESIDGLIGHLDVRNKQ